MSARGRLLLLTLLVWPAALDAQAVGTGLGYARAHGWHIRALSQDVMHAEGKVRALDSGYVSLDTARLPLLNITALERRVITRPGKTIGAIIGLVGFGFLAYRKNEGVSDVYSQIGIVSAGAAGALLGGFFGESLSPTRRQWQRIWP